MDEEKKEEKSNMKVLLTSLEKGVAKYCNRVLFDRIEDDIIFTFLSVIKKETGDEEGILIERIITNKKHAQEIIEVLSNLINT